MSFFRKLGVVAKFWDAGEAPAITFFFRVVLFAVFAAIGYGLWGVFGG